MRRVPLVTVDGMAQSIVENTGYAADALSRSFYRRLCIESLARILLNSPCREPILRDMCVGQMSSNSTNVWFTNCVSRSVLFDIVDRHVSRLLWYIGAT